MTFWRSHDAQTLRGPIALLLIIAVAVALRLPGLGRDLVTDEALSLFVARGTSAATRVVPNGPEFTVADFMRDGGWGESLRAMSHSERTPPLYYLLLRVWIRGFGDSNQSVRLLSVSFAIATIPALFLLARAATDARTGLAAAGILAILPLHLQYSQEVRAYTLAILLLTLATWAYWRGLQTITRPNEIRYWLLYTGLAAASLYTHYFAAGVLIGHGVWAMVGPGVPRIELLKRLAVIACVLTMLLLPWLVSPYFHDQLALNTMYPDAPGDQSASILRRFVAAIGISTTYLLAGGLPGIQLKSMRGLVMSILCIIGSAIMLNELRYRVRRHSVIFSFLLFIIPIIFMIILAIPLGYSSYYDAAPRFALFATIGFCLLLGRMIISARHAMMSVAVIALVSVLSFNFQTVFSQAYSASYRPGFGVWALGNVSPVVAELNRIASHNDLTIFDDDHLMCVWNAYQTRHLQQIYMSRTPWFLNDPASFEGRWSQVDRDHPSIFFVRRAESPPGELMHLLEASYVRQSSTIVERLEILHYRQSAGRRGVGPPPDAAVAPAGG